jgi:hypothetical protein
MAGSRDLLQCVWFVKDQNHKSSHCYSSLLLYPPFYSFGGVQRKKATAASEAVWQKPGLSTDGEKARAELHAEDRMVGLLARVVYPVKSTAYTNVLPSKCRIYGSFNECESTANYRF